LFYNREGNSTGQAEIIFFSINDAETAIQKYNGTLLDGRT